MTDQAQKLVDEGGLLVVQGDESYWQAGLKFTAALDADPTLSLKEIGKRIGKSDKFVGVLVRHVTTAKPDSPIDWGRGTHATKQEIEEGAKKLLSGASPEKLKSLVSGLTPGQQHALITAVIPEPTLTPGTMAHAVTVPEVQMRQAASRSKHERMQEISGSIRAIASMDVEEFVRHSNWEYDSDHAPSLRTIGRELDAAIDKLQTLRGRITARLLEVNG